MTASKLLQDIGDIYVPGAVHYFDQMNPNPWQENLDAFEAVTLKLSLIHI